MITERPVTLHIGLMKTATTMLQSTVFPHTPGLTYRGKPLPALARPIRAITTLDDEDWTRVLPEVEEAFRRDLGRPGPGVLISEEEFSIGGEFDSRADRVAIAGRLHHLFPQASVILVVRNQLTALASLYAYVVGGMPEPPSFRDWLDHHGRATVPGRGLDLFDYAALIRLYTERFGSDRVHVLLYEDLVRDRAAFLRQICRVLRLPEDAMAHIPESRRNTRPANVEACWEPERRARIEARYAASNAWLAEFVDTDLNALEYPCP